MTGLLLTLLGIASTGLVYPNYEGFDPTLDVIEQQQQMVIDEQERNYLAEQEEIIIDDYFLFLDKIGKIKYARGCMGEYTPPVWSEEKQKRVKCSDNAFDCAGLVKGYGIAKGIITAKEASHMNSQTIVLLGKKKDAILAKRGDFTSRQGFGDRSTGNLSTHFAVVSRDYTGGNILWIYDNVNGPNQNIIGERAIKVVYVRGKFYYIGKYRISVFSNGLVEEAKRKELTVDSWIDVEKEDEKFMSKIDQDNPLGFSVTISGFPYDSIANRVASYRYDNNPDKADAIDMITTMIHENGAFDHTKRSPTRDSGLCQLQYNNTNRVWIDDPRRDSWEYQMEVCLSKRLVVSNKNLRAGYKIRSRYIDKIIYY